MRVRASVAARVVAMVIATGVVEEVVAGASSHGHGTVVVRVVARVIATGVVKEVVAGAIDTVFVAGVVTGAASYGRRTVVARVVVRVVTGTASHGRRMVVARVVIATGVVEEVVALVTITKKGVFGGPCTERRADALWGVIPGAATDGALTRYAFRVSCSLLLGGPSTWPFAVFDGASTSPPEMRRTPFLLLKELFLLSDQFANARKHRKHLLGGGGCRCGRCCWRWCRRLRCG